MDNLEEVAVMYMTALRMGSQPVATISNLMGIDRLEAVRLISAARKRGLLRDRGDGVNLKALLVADALGVRRSVRGSRSSSE